MLERLKKFAWGYVILALVIIGIGVCFIAFSDMLAALAIAVGVTLAVFGIIFGVLTLARKDRSI